MTKQPQKPVRWILKAAVALCLLAAVAFAAGKLYQKAHILYDQVANTLFTVEEKVASIDQKTETPRLLDCGLTEPYAFDYTWAEENPPLIAHAMGGIDGQDYTNCLEAFQYNYSLGHRVFEVDFDLTKPDYEMICVHDEARWRQFSGVSDDVPYTYDNFIQSTLLSQYTPLDYRDIVHLLADYPDIYLVMDTKYTDFSRVHIAFTKLVDYAMTVDPTVLDRVIPQIYHAEMLSWVMDIHPFQSVILTLYQTPWSADSVYRFCVESGVRFITMPEHRVDPEAIGLWHQLGIQVATHTINDVDTLNTLMDNGVDVFYTDFVSPEDL